VARRPLVPRRPTESAVETTHAVLPPDTNHHGTAFGGIIMQWMDIAAGIAAARHSRGEVVTIAVDELLFTQPIRLGDIVVIKASVNFAGHTSMEVGVRVESENTASSRRLHCLSGYFTMVGIDAKRRPRPVPPVVPASADERRRYAAAQVRRAARLRRKSTKTAAGVRQQLRP
jgi:acyl-CoA hydrolase